MDNFVELSINEEVYKLECILCGKYINFTYKNDLSIKNHHKVCNTRSLNNLN